MRKQSLLSAFLAGVLLAGCSPQPPPPQPLTSPQSPVPVAGTRRVPAVLNTCRAYFAAGWYLLVSERADFDKNGKPKNVISFRHPSYGTLEARIDVGRSTYTPTTQTAEFWGVGKFQGKGVVVKAVVSSTGGFYRRGTTTLQAWEDKNRSGTADFGEPQIFPSANAISNQSTSMTFARGESIPPVEG
jgi:hypothetical protein